MNSISKLDETGDDTVSFAELETKFSKVVSDLVNDKSLEKFRIEYEKLHDALIESHNHNKVLVSKCTELNEDIVKNSKQISSIILMTQNDQKTIATLRSEFQKAWNLVEGSSDREQKSRNIINSLKQEVANLTQLIQKTETKTDDEEYSSQTLEEDNKTLKDEIAKNENILDELRNQLETTRVEISILLNGNIIIPPKITTLEKEIKESQKEIESIQQESLQIQRDMKSTEETINNNTKEQLDIKKTIKERKYVVKDRERVLDQVKDSMLVFLEDQKRIFNDLDQFKIRLIEAQKGTRDTQAVHDRLTQRLEEKSNPGVDYQKILNDLEKEHDDLIHDEEEIKRYRKELTEVKMQHRKALADNRDVIVMQTLAANTDDLEKRRIRITSDAAEKEIRDINNDIAIEKEAKEMEQIQQKGTLDAINLQKRDLQESRKFIQKMEDESKEHIQTAANYDNETNSQLARNYKLKVRLGELDRELEGVRAHIKTVEEIKAVVQNERDKLNIALQNEYKLQEKLEKENSLVYNDIQVLKNDIREMDLKAGEQHLNRLELLEELERLTNECQQIREDTDEMIKRANELEKQVNTKRHVSDEADLDISVRKRDINSTLQNMIVIKNQISIKVQERNLQFSQIKVLENQLNQGITYFNKIQEKLKELDNEFRWLLEKQKQLYYRIRLLERLRIEKLRIERDLINAQSQVVVLEEELKHPITVSKWVFLDSANPELASLLRFKLDILNKMANKMAISRRLAAKKETILDEISHAEKKLVNCRSTRVNIEYSYLQQELKKKNRELKQMKRVYDENYVSVNQYSEDVTSARDELRDERNAYYNIRQKSINVRNVAQIDQKTSFRRSNAKPEMFYFGGGFAYGSVQNVPLVQPPTKQTTASVATAKAKKAKSKKNSFLPSFSTISSSSRDSRRRFNSSSSREECDSRSEESYSVKPPKEPSSQRSSRRSRRRNNSENY